MKKCLVCKRHIALHSNKKYCSKECRDVDESKRLRKKRAASRPDRRCKNCGLLIKTLYRRSFCNDACYDAFNLDVRRRQYKSTVREKTCCICGETFHYNQGPIPAACKKESCRRAHKNEKNRDRWAGLPAEAKKRKTDSIDRYIKREEGQILMAKCPGCGQNHQYRFTPAWIGNGVPRVGCINYPYCVRNEDGHGYFGIAEPFEMDNRAYI